MYIKNIISNKINSQNLTSYQSNKKIYFYSSVSNIYLHHFQMMNKSRYNNSRNISTNLCPSIRFSLKNICKNLRKRSGPKKRKKHSKINPLPNLLESTIVDH